MLQNYDYDDIFKFPLIFPFSEPDHKKFNFLTVSALAHRSLGSTRMKDLQSCVERVMAATDCEYRHDPSVTFEELDEILDQIAAISSVSLRERVKEKYGGRIRTDESLSRIFRILNSSEAKWPGSHLRNIGDAPISFPFI
jgi:hypothetical protein